MNDKPSHLKAQQVFEQESFAEPQPQEVVEDIQHLQQQLIFGEQELPSFESELKQDSSIEQAIDTQLPVAAALSRKKRSWSLPAKLLGGCVSLIVAIETGQFFSEIWTSSAVIASLYTGAFALALGLAAKVGFREYRQLKRLKQVAHWQHSSQRMECGEQIGEAPKLCQQIAKALPQTDKNTQAVALWQGSLQSNFTDKEVVTLFSDMVLTDIDDQSLKLISRYATETSLMVAISPLALMDMALVLWRSIKMINEICQLYGVKLGYWSRIRLIKTVMVNVVYAGVSELIADVGAAALSLELAGKMSSRAAQGLGAGLLTGRLGFQVMQMCRPVPAPAHKQKRLGDLSKQLLSNIRHALGNKKPE